MGWASGSYLMDDVIHTIKREIPCDDTRSRIYYSLIKSFQDHDWDTTDECYGLDNAWDHSMNIINEQDRIKVD